MKTITLALTGASGLPYGMRLLECLLQGGQRVHLVYSQAAQIVAKQELDFTLPNRPQDAEKMLAERFGKFSGELHVYGRDDWYAPMASGSNPGDAMVICPCTMGTLAAVAAGLSDDLITRSGCDAEGKKAIDFSTARIAILGDPSGEHAQTCPRRCGYFAAQSGLLLSSAECAGSGGFRGRAHTRSSGCGSDIDEAVGRAKRS